MESLQQKKGFMHLNGASDTQVSEAQTRLGLLFSADYAEYVRHCGAATFEAHELTGVCASPRLDVVTVTESNRKKNPTVPKDWYVIEELNMDDESIWQDGAGCIYAVFSGKPGIKIAESLSEYIGT